MFGVSSAVLPLASRRKRNGFVAVLAVLDFSAVLL